MRFKPSFLAIYAVMRHWAIVGTIGKLQSNMSLIGQVIPMEQDLAI